MHCMEEAACVLGSGTLLTNSDAKPHLCRYQTDLGGAEFAAMTVQQQTDYAAVNQVPCTLRGSKGDSTMLPPFWYRCRPDTWFRLFQASL